MTRIRLPGGEILGETIQLSDGDFTAGQGLLEALTLGEDVAREALVSVAVDEDGYFSVESGRLASVIFIPRPDFEIARQIRHWPAGRPYNVSSAQPIRIRAIHLPSEAQPYWKLASAIEPSPDYRYQQLAFSPAEALEIGHRMAVADWIQPAV
ncbi:hypothetical protein HY380_01555 [Candidatus Saccharibacteria bacterium]|nr:hypothetical protein [Candidatus Saccharibacteria bacterium]